MPYETQELRLKKLIDECRACFAYIDRLESSSFTQVAHLLMQAIFFPDPEVVDADCLSSSLYPFSAPLLMYLFLVLSVILLLNMLIAMMGQSLEKVAGALEQHYTFVFGSVVMAWDLNSDVPPPFNILRVPYSLLALLARWLDTCRQHGRTKYEALDRPIYGWLAGEERSPEVPKWYADGLARVEKEAAESTGEVIDRYCREHGDERAAQVQSRWRLAQSKQAAEIKMLLEDGVLGHQQLLLQAIGEKLQLDVAEPSRRAGATSTIARASARVSALTGSRQNTPRGRWSSPPDTL